MQWSGAPAAARGRTARQAAHRQLRDGRRAAGLPGAHRGKRSGGALFPGRGPLDRVPGSGGELRPSGRCRRAHRSTRFPDPARGRAADRERTTADFRRYASLYEKDAVSQAQLDQRRAAMEVAQASARRCHGRTEGHDPLRAVLRPGGGTAGGQLPGGQAGPADRQPGQPRRNEGRGRSARRPRIASETWVGDASCGHGGCSAR